MAMTIKGADEARGAGEGQCIATARTTGERCGRRAMKGTTLCVVHAPRRDIRKRGPAFAVIDEFTKLYDPDAPPVSDPIHELQRLGGIARNAINVAGQKVNELQNWQSVDAKGTAQLKVEIQLWVMLVTRSESILTTLAKLGIDERRVQMQEREQQLVIAALRAIAGDPDLALTQPQRQAWESVVPRHLRAIMASSATVDARTE